MLRLQFMIFLSALLASLTGLVAGERQPVRAQVEMSAGATLASADRAVAVAQPVMGLATPDRSGPTPVQAHASGATPVQVIPGRTRLALKQSWLF